jgi:hypothetical protein
MGIVEKRGAFYRYKEGLLGQGRENAKAFLRENLPMRDEIEDQIRAQFGMPTLSGVRVAVNGNGTPPPLRVGVTSNGDGDGSFSAGDDE